VIRRFKNINPTLTFAFVLLWTFHFSFGMFTHYHPEYVHAHDGELAAHAHGGHFHSLEMDTLAHLIEPDHHHQPLLPGETHHHSESMPGGDAESAQYDFNQSGVTKVVKVAVQFHPSATAVAFTAADLEHSHTQQITSDTIRLLLLPQNHSGRSPPLRV
jgi:hypothetical protein